MKLIEVLVFVLAAISLSFIKRFRNNVCKTFEDYYSNRDENKNCYYNPDDELTTPQVIKRWGYPVEEHQALTKDGYILTLFRIPYGKNSISKQPGRAVFIQHGYKSSSKTFVSTGRKSLAFILADQGYDVWLGNFRGTMYSRNHVKITEFNMTFWDFSFHEHGIYDVPAQVNLVASTTKQKIIFIGYSMGATAATIYSNTYPEEAQDKVKLFVMLAPFIYPNGMSFATTFGLTIWHFMGPYAQALTDGKYYPERYRSANAALWKFLCYPYPFQMHMCQFFDRWSFGFNNKQIDPETLPVTLLHLSETSSIKTVRHIAQLVWTGNFQQFDYGAEENLRRYGSPEPPDYKFDKMLVPVYVVRADNDLAATKVGVEKFNAALPEKIKPFFVYVVNNEKFNHIDFVFAKDVVALLYNHLIQIMSNF